MKKQGIELMISFSILLLFAFAFGTDNHPWDYIAAGVGGGMLGGFINIDHVYKN